MRGLGFWGYCVAVVIVILAALYVSRQDQKAAEQCEEKTARVNAGPVSPGGHGEDADECTKDAERHLPRLYSLFRWPSGATALAIILTLLAIAESTAAMRNNIALQFRPQLIIRKIAIHRGTEIPTLGVKDSDPWKIEYEIANVGQGAASKIQYGFSVLRYKMPLPPRIVQTNNESLPSPIQPGDSRICSTPIDEQLVLILRHIGPDGLREGWQGTDRIWFSGTAQYFDGNGIKRNLSVCRRYDNKTDVFVPDSNPDREYSD